MIPRALAFRLRLACYLATWHPSAAPRPGWCSGLRLPQNVPGPLRGGGGAGPCSCVELALGYGQAGGDSQRKGKKFLAECFNAAAVLADAVSHHRRGKREARIEQRREDQTHVSTHQSRERDGRGVSGLLPPPRWHLGKNRAGRRETDRGKDAAWAKRRVEWRKSDAQKKRRRRRIRTAAH